MTDLAQLTAAIEAGDRSMAITVTKTAIDEGIAAESILAAMATAMDVVGERFQRDEIYVPEMLVSARAMKEATLLLHPWENLPQEMGCGSGMTCWRRLRDWNEAGVWERLHQVLLDELQDAGALDWSRAVVDSSHVRAKGGAPRPAPRPSTAAGRVQSIT